MGFLLKIVVFGIAAYMAWTAAKRWLGLGVHRPPPPLREGMQSRGPSQAGPQPSPVPRHPVVEDTRACPACGVYVSVSAAKCGRSDCPQPV
ncbi:MAG TPA: hypothetical protein VMI56_02065 [Reyranella sp.]|nr:hypothetical protein [Reyranella sp.]